MLSFSVFPSQQDFQKLSPAKWIQTMTKRCLTVPCTLFLPPQDPETEAVKFYDMIHISAQISSICLFSPSDSFTLCFVILTIIVLMESSHSQPHVEIKDNRFHLEHDHPIVSLLVWWLLKFDGSSVLWILRNMAELWHYTVDSTFQALSMIKIHFPSTLPTPKLYCWNTVPSHRFYSLNYWAT